MAKDRANKLIGSSVLKSTSLSGIDGALARRALNGLIGSAILSAAEAINVITTTASTMASTIAPTSDTLAPTSGSPCLNRTESDHLFDDLGIYQLILIGIIYTGFIIALVLSISCLCRRCRADTPLEHVDCEKQPDTTVHAVVPRSVAVSPPTVSVQTQRVHTQVGFGIGPFVVWSPVEGGRARVQSSRPRVLAIDDRPNVRERDASFFNCNTPPRSVTRDRRERVIQQQDTCDDGFALSVV